MQTIQTPKAFRELYQPSRYKVYWGGRGGAKSTAFADALLVMGGQAPLRILCCREIQKSIKESVYSLLKDRIAEHGMGDHYDVLNTEIRGKNGTRFFFEGLWNNVDSIKSIEGVDICWVEEANTVSEASWAKLIPTIRKEGSEIWASFNPALKSDAAYQRFIVNPPPTAIVRKVSWRDNPWITQELMDEMEHLKETDYESYLHVWEGELKDFADGAIYGKQLKQIKADGQICDLPITPSVEVHTFWDLGRNDTTAIWFMQHVGPWFNFIDYYECRLVDLDHYIRVLKEKDYLYGAHYLPHDVEVTDLSAKTSRREILERGGVKPLIVVPRINQINEGLEMTRQVLPMCRFDKTRCDRGIESLSNYEYVYDEKYQTHRPTPLHNWASNGSDAFRQFAQGYRARPKTQPHMSERRREAIRRNQTKSGASWIV